MKSTGLDEWVDYFMETAVLQPKFSGCGEGMFPYEVCVPDGRQRCSRKPSIRFKVTVTAQKSLASFAEVFSPLSVTERGSSAATLSSVLQSETRSLASEWGFSAGMLLCEILA